MTAYGPVPSIFDAEDGEPFGLQRVVELEGERGLEEELVHELRERQRRQREVEAGQPQHRDRHQRADRGRDEHRDQEPEQVGLIDLGVRDRADPGEGELGQRDVAAVAGQQDQGEHHDRVGGRSADQQQVGVGHAERRGR